MSLRTGLQAEKEDKEKHESIVESNVPRPNVGIERLARDAYDMHPQATVGSRCLLGRCSE